MWWVYCLRSETGGTYIGYSGRVHARLKQHNSGGVQSTRGHRWEHEWLLGYNTSEAARVVEQWFKTGDTKQKREMVSRLFEAGFGETARKQCLQAAIDWRSKTNGKPFICEDRKEKANAVVSG